MCGAHATLFGLSQCSSIFSAFVYLDCPALVVSENTFTNTEETYYGIMVYISCQEGYKFKQEEYIGQTSLSVHCLLGGHWDKEGRIPDCQGNLGV